MTQLRVIRRGPRENAGDYSYEEIEYHQTPVRASIGDNAITKLVSNAAIHALDGLLTAVLSPIMIYQWLSKHEQLMLILRVFCEVVLELIMLMVFAGVSILTAAALIFDDLYNEVPSSTTCTLESRIPDEIEEKVKEKPPTVRRPGLSKTFK